MDDLLNRIIERIQQLAQDTFDPEEAVDSDGIDQATQDGLEQALSIVQDEFRKAKRRAS